MKFTNLTDACQKLRSMGDQFICPKDQFFGALADEIERLTRERDELKCLRDSLTGWWVAKECDNGSLILQSHTGQRKHVWQSEKEEREGGMSTCKFCGTPTYGHRSCCTAIWSCRFKMLEQIQLLRSSLKEIAAFDDDVDDLDYIAVNAVAIAKIALVEGKIGKDAT